MMFDLHLTSIWPLFWPEMTQVWPCKSENGYLVTVECQIIQSHPRMLHFKVPRKHSWFWRSWRSNGGQNEVGSFRRWHIRKIWAKIGLCAKYIPNPLKTVAANPPPTLKVLKSNAPFVWILIFELMDGFCNRNLVRSLNMYLQWWNKCYE